MILEECFLPWPTDKHVREKRRCRQFVEVLIDAGSTRWKVLTMVARDRIERGRLARQPRWGPPRVPTRGFSVL
jgi:hypothetical protein